MAHPPLLIVAHGSRDSRSAATVRALAEVVRAHSPGADVRVAFLDLSAPSVGTALSGLYAEGHRHVVAVPLLLGHAYHARVDLPALVDEVTGSLPRLSVTVADVLGPDPLLEDVALDRLAAAGADLDDPDLGVVLAAVGSSHDAANDVVARIARGWDGRRGARVAAAFASTARPDVPAAIARLRAHGARRFAVASWFFAPGLLPDRIAALAAESAPDAVLAAPLGTDPRVATVVLDRYADALTGAAASA
ncbi:MULTISPECIES: sirohydrochlorin chelatase [Prauserella salsuginis group]|uniref:Sirohydrochlorin chelatase n=1 Tax=Prauserella salsuginis TaxID=387889 RepID=A0ABW6G5E3_9PSEU|nr:MULTISPECIES: sirohydrochlorin chelatase [Prauserella salsuginis group]MCR3718955.1 Sirohydrochlorin ferrochelatase [Prauserella flava]MCR3733525.1 Sirohydrochlorin ferrochelatase [Prauserella salsuginis]